MLVPTLFALLLTPFTLVSAQSNASGSANVHLSTTIISSVGLGPDRQPSTLISTQVLTITDPPPQATPGPSANSTQSSGSGSGSNAPSSSAKPLPTAANDVPGGGDGPKGAPAPGILGPSPDDNWTSDAPTIKIHNAAYAIGVVVGGALLL